MYQYKAVVQKIVDGDTYEIDIDLGMSVWVKNERIRLFGIDTPEVFGVKKGSTEYEMGLKSSEYVKKVFEDNKNVLIETFKDKKEKYGRYLALLYVKLEDQNLVGNQEIRCIDDYFCFNDVLVYKGLAKKYPK